MTVDEVNKYYGSVYRFRKVTGMSASTLCNWRKWGYVPWRAQVMLEKMSGGSLRADEKDRRK